MRADRLLSLMLQLRSSGRLTAKDLSERLEVSERTIYRDIDALSAAGIPIYTQQGVHGGVFLDENYRISLTGLTQQEVMSLFVAQGEGPLGDLGLGAAAEESLLKLFAALPGIHRQEAERMRQRVYIDPTNWFQIVEVSSFLPVLQQAVMGDQRVAITYQSVAGSAPRQRIIDPHALVAKANIWYLVACKPDGPMHTYRLSRLEAVELLDEHFRRDPDFDLAAYWRESCAQFEAQFLEVQPPYWVTIRVDPEWMWYFAGHMPGRYETLNEAASDDHWTTIKILFSNRFEARMVMSGVGAGAVILEPTDLAADVLAWANATVAAYPR